MAKLEYKLLITGNIIVETGLHIGGSEVDLDIGGIDKEVIKVKQGNKKVPYIPGSSLKGKLRTLIGRAKGYKDIKADDGETLSLFAGTPTYQNHTKRTYSGVQKDRRDRLVAKTPTRLIVRDSYLKADDVPLEDRLEDKAENVIDRATGEANPRHLERVTKGAIFGLDMVLDIYRGDDAKKLLETLDLGFQILKRDYLGGSGTRGYGKIDVTDLKIKKMIFKEDGSIDDAQAENYSFKANPAE